MLFLIFACAQEAPNDSVMLCNGFTELCDKNISEALFAGTHNSMSAQEEGWLGPNHVYPIPTQLKDGIRALNIDTYWWEEEAYMCHTFCEIGAQPLSYATDAIAEFLTQNPNNVIIITFQSTLTAEETLQPFNDSGLQSELYHHETGTQWPTLQTLIENKTRLLLFSNQDGGRINGYMSQWEHWLDNPYSAQGVEDFACLPDRGDESSATLYNINHFLTNPIALPELAQEANKESVLTDHIQRCISETELPPTQILVDFYSIGNTIDVVHEYNRQD
tara:strand:+ start:658 stop:1485 length:828 start_codon:yes stop_codon:yes gene_type:complete